MLDEYTSAPPPSRISAADLDENTRFITKQKPLSTILKDAVLSKFGAGQKSVNASAWLNLFESECIRLEVPSDRFWEALRLFLEKSAED